MSAATPKKIAKKPAKAINPPYTEMVAKAVFHVKAVKDRGGSSKYAIKKYILAHYHVQDSKATTAKINLALERGVACGALCTAPNHPGHFQNSEEGKAILKAAYDYCRW